MCSVRNARNQVYKEEKRMLLWDRKKKGREGTRRGRERARKQAGDRNSKWRVGEGKKGSGG